MTLSKGDLLKQDELWILLFVLGVILVNWPFFSLVEKAEVFGYPLVLIYLLAVWIAIVFVTCIFDREERD